MTDEPMFPARTAIFQNLHGRVEVARRTWRAPVHIREAATAEDVQAARNAVRADTQALRLLVTKYGWPGRRLVGDENSAAALAIALQADHDPALQRTLLTMLAEAARCGGERSVTALDSPLPRISMVADHSTAPREAPPSAMPPQSTTKARAMQNSTRRALQVITFLCALATITMAASIR